MEASTIPLTVALDHSLRVGFYSFMLVSTQNTLTIPEHTDINVKTKNVSWKVPLEFDPSVSKR